MEDKMSSLFPPIDEEGTISNCKRFLLRVFPRMLRISGLNSGNYDELIAGLQSPKMDGMPKAPNHANNSDISIVRRVYAQQIVQMTVKAMGKCSATSKNVLSMLYLDGYTDTMCLLAVGYSHSQYFDKVKPKAILEFADVYELDDLHIYATDTDDLKRQKRQATKGTGL